MNTLTKIHQAIDQISESVSINGCESNIVDFLINHLAAFADDLAQKYEEEETEEEKEEGE